jgi:predicted nucleic acid-binding protein
LVLAEVLAGARITPIERRLYMELIVWNPLVLLAPVSREILIDASDLRRQAGHKLADAIHIATALRANCKFVVSRDRDMRKLPSALMALLDTGADAAKSLIEAANGR